MENQHTAKGSFDEDKYDLVQEGQARVLFDKKGEVFYNPVQEFNRDLTVAVIRKFEDRFRGEKEAYANKRREKINNSKDLDEAKKEDMLGAIPEYKGIGIMEALSATGLRSIRYALECQNVRKIIANDFDANAVKAIHRNIEFNGICTKKVIANQDDASVAMLKLKNAGDLYEVIDLDPYGAPVQFLDAAFQCVQNGGLMCVTCTDPGVLCANRPEAGFAKYGTMSLKAKYGHESALRMALACMQTHASRHKKYIKPLMSLSIDFYLRMFFRVYESPQEVKRASLKVSYLYNCVGCESFEMVPVGKVNDRGSYSAVRGPGVAEKCEHCGSSKHLGGPAWNGPIHDGDFVKEVLDHVVEKGEKDFKTFPRLNGFLNVVAEELPDAPFFRPLTHLASVVHATSPKLAVMQSAIANAGYKSSVSHCSPEGLKTDCPTEMLWDIMRCWVKKNPLTAKRKAMDTPGNRILSKEPTIEADFTINPKALSKSRESCLVRFPELPPNWGPRARAGTKRAEEDATGSDMPGGIASETRANKQRAKRKAKPERSLKHIPCVRFRNEKCDLSEEECRYSHDMSLELPKVAKKQKKKYKEA
eukprot:Nk52_evm119s151 gene=Nk52_evmTU119s151